MGQWIQEGERTIFETVISVVESKHEKFIPSDEANLDGLNYIAGKHVDEVNKMAELGTRIAHVDGGVPNMLVTIPHLKKSISASSSTSSKRLAVSAATYSESIHSTSPV